MAATSLALSNVVFFATVSAVAAGYDVYRRRIPNWITVTTAVTGVAARGAAFGVRGAGSAAAAVLLVLVLLAAMWRFRFIGGGDAKLGAAAAAWVGWGETLPYLVTSAIVGFAIALVCYAAAGARARVTVGVNLWRRRVPTLPEARATGTVLVPYGAAFAIAAIVVVLS